MKLLLIAGGLHRIIHFSLQKKFDIVNSNSLKLRDAQGYIHNIDIVPDVVIITDQAFTQSEWQDKDDLQVFLDWAGKLPRSGLQVLIFTNNIMMEPVIRDLTGRYGNLKIVFFDQLRISGYIINKTLEGINQKRRLPDSADTNTGGNGINENERKKSILERFKPRPKNNTLPEATETLTKELQNIGRGLSRIMAVTGHRGSGLTSTVVNLASEAVKHGLSVIIVDLDIEYRSTNMYFSSFHEKTKRDEDINASLIHTLARPHEYLTTAFNVKDNLWITGLGYHFNDRKLLEQFYTSSKLIGLLSMLRNKFNIIILDIPMDLFKILGDLMIHVDIFGLCVSNNLYSVLSTLRNVEVVLDNRNTQYLNAKSKLIVTKFNSSSRFQDEIFTSEKVCEVLTSGLNESFSYEMKVAGQIPYGKDFDSQIETDIPVVNISTEYEKAYGNIILRLMEGSA